MTALLEEGARGIEASAVKTSEREKLCGCPAGCSKSWRVMSALLESGDRGRRGAVVSKCPHGRALTLITSPAGKSHRDGSLPPGNNPDIGWANPIRPSLIN